MKIGGKPMTINETDMLYIFGVECIFKIRPGTSKLNSCFTANNNKKTNDIPELRRTDFLAEYVTCDTLGQEQEYDDPIPWLEVVERSGKYHSVIVNVDLNDEYIVVVGSIVMIKDLASETKLPIVSPFVYEGEGSVELEIISTTFPNIMVLTHSGSTAVAATIDVPVPHMVDIPFTARVAIIGQGTNGDIRPLQMIQQELLHRGINVKFIAPLGITADAHYDQTPFVDLYSKNPQAVPKLSYIAVLPTILSIYRTWVTYCREEKIDLIIAAPMVIGIRYLAESIGAQLVEYGSIPTDSGHVYAEQHSVWDQYFASLLQGLVVATVNLPGAIDQLSMGKLSIPKVPPSVVAVAPELFKGGVGALSMNNPTGKNHAGYEIFFCLGSIQNKIVEEQFLRILVKLDKPVLFQTEYKHDSWPNITYIGKCNHEDVMRSIPNIICHGGSGIVQTAMKYGCRIFIRPFWADQRYWASRFPHRSVWCLVGQEDRLFTILKDNVGSHTGASITTVSVKRIVAEILSHYKSEIGTFVYWANIGGFPGTVASVDRFLFGDTLMEHMGIGHRNISGKVCYMEMVPSDGTKAKFVQFESLGIASHITRIEYIDMPYDPNQFRSLCTHYNALFHNCRSVVYRYMASYGKCVLHSPKFGVHSHTNNYPTIISDEVVHTSKSRVESSLLVQSTPSAESTMNPLKDGDCFYACLAYGLGCTIQSIKDLILPEYNKVRAEFGHSSALSLPYYIKEEADFIPLAASRALLVELNIASYQRKKLTIFRVGEGKGYHRMVLRLEYDHYQFYKDQAALISAVDQYYLRVDSP